MRPIQLLVFALFVGTFTASPAFAQVDYAPWKKTEKGNYYRVCKFPKGEYQYLILFKDKPKWVYWYNQKADKFWSCCPTIKHPKWGEDAAAGKDRFLIAIVKAAKIEDCKFPEDDGPNFKPGATAKDKDGSTVNLGCPPPDLPDGV